MRSRAARHPTVQQFVAHTMTINGSHRSYGLAFSRYRSMSHAEEFIPSNSTSISTEHLPHSDGKLVRVSRCHLRVSRQC